MEKNIGTVGAVAFARKLSGGKLASKAYAIWRISTASSGFKIRKSDNNSDRKSSILWNAIIFTRLIFLEINSIYIAGYNTILDFYTNMNYDLIACTVDI